MEKIEIWKDVPNYDGIYQVSNLGRVKSFRKDKDKNYTILTIRKNIKGYLHVPLYKNGKKKNRVIHQLIAMAFLGHIPDGTTKICVDHIDNNKLNNTLENLQLISNRENCTKDRKGGSSKFTGVSWDKSKNKWKSQIKINCRSISLGLFDIELEASDAYQKSLHKYNFGFADNH